MTESTSNFKNTGLYSNSALTYRESFQKQFKTVSQSQVTPQVKTWSPISQAPNPTFITK